jgi:hypothetical protein
VWHYQRFNLRGHSSRAVRKAIFKQLKCNLLVHFSSLPSPGSLEPNLGCAHVCRKQVRSVTAWANLVLYLINIFWLSPTSWSKIILERPIVARNTCRTGAKCRTNSSDLINIVTLRRASTHGESSKFPDQWLARRLFLTFSRPSNNGLKYWDPARVLHTSWNSNSGRQRWELKFTQVRTVVSLLPFCIPRHSCDIRLLRIQISYCWEPKSTGDLFTY